MMETLREKIKIISRKESELLKADKLSKNSYINTGLYLVCEPERYLALDFSERQSWSEYFGSKKDAPQGWVQEFPEPLSAIDWLLSLKK